jgi:hypothetical protein
MGDVIIDDPCLGRPTSGTPYENAAGQQPCPCMIVP